MKLLRRLLPYLVVLLILVIAWLWWNRPQKAEMAAYVPADSLIYLEANSLPNITSGLTQTDAWQALLAPAGIRRGLGEAGWLTRIAAWTGIGPADAVVFARAQIAATVLSIQAADGGETLNVRPRIAVVVETHTGASRSRAAIERRVGDFARRAYGDPHVEERDADDAHWFIWSAQGSERRIIAAVSGSVAVIGNDEEAVRACLAVKRGERPSLYGNVEMEEMRRRVASKDELAFGYISTQGASQLFDVAAALYASQLSQNTQVQSLAANILPQMARKILGSVGWSTRLAGGEIEDTYFFSLRNDAAARLRDAFTDASAATLRESEFLPPETYSLTRYTTRDALAAWRGLNFSVSSQLDPVLALMVSPVLKSFLAPYKLDEEPDQFMQAIGAEFMTARLDSAGGSTVTIVEVRDEKALREFIFKLLGTKTPQAERVGEAEMLSSADEKRGAVSFTGGYLLMGSKESVRRCLAARQQGRTLKDAQDFQKALSVAAALGTTHIVTFTEDTAPARDFINFIANQRGIRAQPTNETELEKSLNQLAYAVSETKLIDGGVERRTRSSFGQLGVLATQFATKN